MFNNCCIIRASSRSCLFNGKLVPRIRKHNLIVVILLLFLFVLVIVAAPTTAATRSRVVIVTITSTICDLRRVWIEIRRRTRSGFNGTAARRRRASRCRQLLIPRNLVPALSLFLSPSQRSILRRLSSPQLVSTARFHPC
jgi:hypothetical protein